MTRSSAPRDPDDLRSVFRNHEGSAVDVPGLLEGVRERIARRRDRRRMRGMVAAGVATALVAVIPIVVTSLPEDNPGGTAASGTAGPSAEPGDIPGAETGADFDPVTTFTVGAVPAGFPVEYARSEPGIQTRSFISPGAEPRNLVVKYLDLAASGRDVPAVQLDPVVVGVREVLPMILESGQLERYGVAWQPESGRWVTVTTTVDDQAGRQEVLDLVASIDVNAQQLLTFPMQVTDVPDGFALRSSYRDVEADVSRGGLRATLILDDRGEGEQEGGTLSIFVENDPEAPATGSLAPNTTVGGHPARYGVDAQGNQCVAVYEVDGMGYLVCVSSEYADRFTEDYLRRIAAGVVVLPGAATDPTVWAAQPLS